MSRIPPYVDRKTALLETLSLTLESYDKGVIEPVQFGALLERLQLFLEAEQPENGEGHRHVIRGCRLGPCIGATECFRHASMSTHCASAGSSAPPHEDRPEHHQDEVSVLQSDLQEAHQRATLQHKAMVQMKEK